MTGRSFALLQRLQPLFASRRTPVYLVGGAVRDALIGRPADDLDFVVAEDAISLAFTVADELRVAAYAMDRERDIGRVVLPAGIVLDFARFRGPDLESDLRSRDFTINAMAIDVAAYCETVSNTNQMPPDAAWPPVPRDALIDPSGGLTDLNAGNLQLTHPHAVDDDPIRALRAVRLSLQLGLQLTTQAAQAAGAAAPRLHEVSRERVRDEFTKLLRGPAPHTALEQLANLGLLEVVLPEIEALRHVQQSAPHHEPALAHTISVLSWLLKCEQALLAAGPQDEISSQLTALLQPYAAGLLQHLQRPVDGMLDGRLLLRLGALFHDAGKARTATTDEDGRIRFFGHDKEGATLARKRLRKLRFSNEAVQHVRDIVAAHMRPLHLANSAANNISRRAVYRYFRSAGSAGLDVALLSLADHLATYDGMGPQHAWRAMTGVAQRLLTHYFEQYDETVAPPPLLDGSELIAALNLKPGPQIGRLLRLIEEAQAAGDIQNKEQALDLARQHL